MQRWIKSAGICPQFCSETPFTLNLSSVKFDPDSQGGDPVKDEVHLIILSASSGTDQMSPCTLLCTLTISDLSLQTRTLQSTEWPRCTSCSILNGMNSHFVCFCTMKTSDSATVQSVLTQVASSWPWSPFAGKLGIKRKFNSETVIDRRCLLKNLSSIWSEFHKWYILGSHILRSMNFLQLQSMLFLPMSIKFKLYCVILDGWAPLWAWWCSSSSPRSFSTSSTWQRRSGRKPWRKWKPTCPCCLRQTMSLLLPASPASSLTTSTLCSSRRTCLSYYHSCNLQCLSKVRTPLADFYSLPGPALQKCCRLVLVQRVCGQNREVEWTAVEMCMREQKAMVTKLSGSSESG